VTQPLVLKDLPHLQFNWELLDLPSDLNHFRNQDLQFGLVKSFFNLE
jgi:hypothetical protein